MAHDIVFRVYVLDVSGNGRYPSTTLRINLMRGPEMDDRGTLRDSASCMS